MADHDFVAFVDVEEFYGLRGSFLPIDRDGAIHHGRAHLNLLAVESDKGLLVRRDVEVVGKNACVSGLGQGHVGATDYFGAVLSQTKDQFVQRVVGIGGNFDSRKALVFTLLADLDLGNLKTGAAGHNLIQHFGQDQRIDNVTAQLNRLRKHRPSVANEIARASPAIAHVPIETGCCIRQDLLD